MRSGWCVCCTHQGLWFVGRYVPTGIVQGRPMGEAFPVFDHDSEAQAYVVRISNRSKRAMRALRAAIWANLSGAPRTVDVNGSMI